MAYITKETAKNIREALKAEFKDIEFVKKECEKLAKQVNDVYCDVLADMAV